MRLARIAEADPKTVTGDRSRSYKGRCEDDPKFAPWGESRSLKDAIGEMLIEAKGQVEYGSWSRYSS
jgi:hypothetical protein